MTQRCRDAVARTDTVSSPAFQAHAEIPQQYTCEGADVPPPLAFDDVPHGTASLAVVVDDPDAPKGRFVHWVLYNLPATTQALPDGMTKSSLPPGARFGTNSFGHVGWSGPCPRAGARRHRYVFTVYALDTPMPNLGTPTRDVLAKAMAGHILDRADLIGTYALKQHGAERGEATHR